MGSEKRLRLVWSDRNHLRSARRSVKSKRIAIARNTDELLTREALDHCILGSAEEIGVYRDPLGRQKRVRQIRIGSLTQNLVTEITDERRI